MVGDGLGGPGPRSTATTIHRYILSSKSNVWVLRLTPFKRSTAQYHNQNPQLRYKVATTPAN